VPDVRRRLFAGYGDEMSDADVTVPTPPEEPHSTVAYPEPRPAPYGSSPYATEAPQLSASTIGGQRPIVELADIWTALLGTVAVVFVGLLATIVWVVTAPRAMAVKNAQGGVSLVSPLTKAFAGADVYYLLITIVAGVLCGLAGAAVARRRGLAVSVAVAGGGILAALLVAWVGRWFTGGPLLHWAHRVPPGTHRLYIELQTRQFIVGWPIAALAVTFIVGLLTPDPPVEQPALEPAPAPATES
jgi:hypothetical protein